MLLANADAIAQQPPPQRERVGYIGYASNSAPAISASLRKHQPESGAELPDFRTVRLKPP